MDFASVLKGRVAERILVTLLERGGYRVTRLGVEELFDEVKYLELPAYLRLGLPEALRSLPDLLVADPGVSWARLLEVKFRRRFDRHGAEELRATLAYQRKWWSESHAVVMIAEPFVEDGRFHQDYIRVIPAGEENALRFPAPVRRQSEDQVAETVWNQLPMLTRLFKFRDFEVFGEERGHQRGQDFWQAADYITQAIKELSRL
jgi:hypothetical protein